MSEPPELDAMMLDLLVAWEDRRAAGDPVTPEDVCGGHPERLDELRRHVARIARLEPFPGLPRPEPAPPVVPGFELLDEVGRGGMGVVYRARDLALDRVVAVKIPFAAAAAGVPRKRFEREARTLAKLRHPNIVPVYAAGLAGDTPYFVMDYVPGGSLAERMAGAAGTPGRAAALMERVARGVGHAHAAGVVHRDLKPSNILLDAAGQPLVGDFGVAALLAGESVATPDADTPDGPLNGPGRGETQLTRTGAAAGTPAYAAPETRSGRPYHPRPTADVWSLGVVLYVCLTGRLPYPDPHAAGPQRPPPPRPRSIRRGVPRGLEAITLRCLAADPAARYPTAADLAAALARWLRRDRLRRRAVGVGRAGLLAAAALGVAAALAWPPTPAERHAAVAAGLARDLAAAGRLDLVPATGAPRTHLVRVNAALAGTGVGEGGVFSAESPRPCLVEFLPDVALDRYRVAAEVRQVSGLFDAEAGLYCAHHEEEAGELGPAHRFVFLAFADVGLLTHKHLGPGGQAGSAVNLRNFRYRPPDPPAGVWQQDAIRWAWYAPPGQAAGEGGPWRRVWLEVTPDALSGGCDDLALPAAPAWVVPRSVLAPRYPRGGAGLYLCGCKVQVRNVSVTRLPEP